MSPLALEILKEAQGELFGFSLGRVLAEIDALKGDWVEDLPTVARRNWAQLSDDAKAMAYYWAARKDQDRWDYDSVME